jgi:hypothetical protein
MICIAVIEDEPPYFKALTSYIDYLCESESMDVKYKILRLSVTTAEIAQSEQSGAHGAPSEAIPLKERRKRILIQKVESLLEEAQEASDRLLLISDDRIRGSGGMFFLQDYLVELWTSADAWLRQTPIIIHTELADKFARLPRRAHSAIVNRIPLLGAEGLKDLEDAVRVALSALARTAN